LGTANHANHANKPSAAFGRNQNLSSRQDAKGAKKTGAKTVPDLGDLGVFARDIILSLPMIYVSRPENFAQENKISTSSSAKPQAFNPNHQHVIASPARQSEPSTDYRLPTTVFFHHREHGGHGDGGQKDWRQQAHFKLDTSPACHCELGAAVKSHKS
jgi:hypothetical protein